jgi:hypothetical protein
MLIPAASNSMLMLVASASMLMPSFLGFFSPQKVNLKIPINSGIGQAGIACPREITLGSWFYQILFLDLAG